MSPVTTQRAHLLSPCQEWIWLLQELQPDSHSYHVPFAFDIDGDLDPSTLEHALQLLVQRHGVLRTSLTRRDGRPAQRISSRARLALRCTDVTALEPGERDAALDDGLLDEMRDSFDLSRAPLARARVFRLGPERHVLSLVLHHFVADGWSTRVCLRDLLALCHHLRDGVPSGLDPLPLQYAEYADAQREETSGHRFDRDVAYWREQLHDAPPPDVPIDHQPAEDSIDVAGQVQCTLSADLVERMRSVAAATHTTLFMTVLAAWWLALARHTGSRDLVVGLVIADRTRADVEALIGCFINVLPVRIRSDRAASPADTLATVRQRTLDAYAHMHVPFLSLVRALAPPRGAYQQTFFDSVVNWLPEAPAATAGSLRMSARSVRPVDTDVPLALYVESRDGTLLVRLVYRTDLLRPSTAEACLCGFRDALDAIIAIGRR